MANRNGRGVPNPDALTPNLNLAQRPAMIENVAAVPRSSGEFYQEAGAAAERVASSIGTLADDAAKVEGAHEGAVAGMDPTYRPTGDASLRGRAYEEAATKTYADNLDARLRDQLQQTYEQHKGDPAGLKAAFETLHTEMSDRDVFPEIQGAFTKQFSVLSQAYRNKATSNAESSANDALKGALVKNLADVDTSTRQAIATLDPADPATEAVVASGVDQTKKLYQRAGASGILTPATVEVSTRAATNGAYGDLLLSRVQKLKTPEQVEAYSTQLTKDFSEGKYDGKLDGAGYEKVKSQVDQFGRAVATASRANVSALEKGFDDLVQREAAGNTPPAAEWNALATTAKDLPGGDQVVAVANAKRTLAAQLTSSSIDQGDAILQRLRADARAAGGVDPVKAQLIDFGQKFLEGERKGLTTDQLGLAQKKGLIPTVSPLDFEGFGKSNDPGAAEAMASQVRARVSQAQAVGATLSRSPQYLRPEEKSRLKEIVDAGGDRALALAGAIVRGAGSDAPNILRQISDDAPLLAQAGSIISSGGSLQAARDAFQAAAVKAQTGKELPSAPDATKSKAYRDEIGGAFMMQAEDGTRARVAADAITQTRMYRGSVDPKSGDADKLYRRALQEATGAVFADGVQYGGVTTYTPGYWSSYKVAVPNGVRADGFKDVIRSLRDDDLKQLSVPPQGSDGKPYSARDFYEAVPVAVRGGYRFSLGDPTSNDPKYIRGADGRPFVLPFDTLAPALRSRVPGAFQGGR